MHAQDANDFERKLSLPASRVAGTPLCSWRNIALVANKYTTCQAEGWHPEHSDDDDDMMMAPSDAFDAADEYIGSSPLLMLLERLPQWSRAVDARDVLQALHDVAPGAFAQRLSSTLESFGCSFLAGPAEYFPVDLVRMPAGACDMLSMSDRDSQSFAQSSLHNHAQVCSSAQQMGPAPHYPVPELQTAIV